MKKLFVLFIALATFSSVNAKNARPQLGEQAISQEITLQEVLNKKNVVTADMNIAEKVVAKKIAKKVAKVEGGKSQLTALLLNIFLGALGVHRFYLGYTGIGILQLLLTFAFGIGFIWSLVDLVRIITGSLQPNGSEYESTL